MTRTGPWKSVDPVHGVGRFRKALAFHEVAKLALEHIGRVRDPDTVFANAVLSAVAYTDSLTAAYGGRVNQEDHAASVKLLRDTLGKVLPETQEPRLARLLGRKDEVQYGAQIGRLEQAEETIKALEAFGDWTKTMLLQTAIADHLSSC